MNIRSLVSNAFTSRIAWLRSLLDTSTRNIDAECQYPTSITYDDCFKMFSRGDVAARAVSLWPNESWALPPVVYETEDEAETEFEKAVSALEKAIPIYPLLHRADVLSGVGRYGVILIGIDDGLDLQEAVAGVGEDGSVSETGEPRKLLYLRPLDEGIAQISELEGDARNPRYGQPKKYNLQFTDSLSSGALAKSTSSVSVHWSRILHLADNRFNSEIFGAPRLEVVYNRLLDVKKIGGGGAEMFWKGGFPGLSLETHPELGDNVTIDAAATKEQIEAYQEGLQRYLALSGMTARSLSVQVADTGPHLEAQLRLIAIALGVPWRVFAGSEAAQLASEQDKMSWLRRVGHRQQSYLTPFVVRPFFERLIAMKVLPKPEEGFMVDWPDLFAPSEKERAETAEKVASAVAKYVQTGGDALIPAFHFLTLVLKYSDKEAESILDAAADKIKDEETNGGRDETKPVPDEDEESGMTEE